ncbi:MAG: nitrate reductase cytochrome c-type subunit [Sulfuricella denitrificans]|nr:nitrate reductase cytochrome c-type subunit [Sulfuricella denitrificans]
MKNSLRLALVALSASAFYIVATPPALSAESAVHSLRGIDVKDEGQAPEMRVNPGKRPGSQKPIARTFQQQPPVIPHATDNFDEITLEENQCLTCHGPEKYKEKKAPKIGDSHFRNQQTGEIMKQMSNARHNCVQCHVPQMDAPPLVENTFKGLPVKAQK